MIKKQNRSGLVWLTLAAFVLVITIALGITRHIHAGQQINPQMPYDTQTRHQTYGKVYLLPLTTEDPQLMEALSSTIKDKLGMRVDKLPARTTPRQAWDASRGQYNAINILSEIDNYAPADATRILAIVDDDLYTPNLNFVFSQGLFNYRSAIVSTYRLKQSIFGEVDHELLIQRTTKTAIKALAFSLGVQSCPDEQCVMHFANSMSELDRKSDEFCPSCTQVLESVLKRQLPAR